MQALALSHLDDSAETWWMKRKNQGLLQRLLDELKYEVFGKWLPSIEKSHAKDGISRIEDRTVLEPRKSHSSFWRTYGDLQTREVWGPQILHGHPEQDREELTNVFNNVVPSGIWNAHLLVCLLSMARNWTDDSTKKKNSQTQADRTPSQEHPRDLKKTATIGLDLRHSTGSRALTWTWWSKACRGT